MQNYCLVVKQGDACPAGFTSTEGATDFSHTHTGIQQHRHDLRIDGLIEGAGMTAENCRPGHRGDGWWDDIICDDWAGGTTVKIGAEGGGLSTQGGGQAWRVCFSY